MDLTFLGVTDKEMFLESKSSIRRVVAEASAVHIAQVAAALKVKSIVEVTITTDEPDAVVKKLESLAPNELQKNFTDQAEDDGVTSVSLQKVSAPRVVVNSYSKSATAKIYSQAQAVLNPRTFDFPVKALAAIGALSTLVWAYRLYFAQKYDYKELETPGEEI